MIHDFEDIDMIRHELNMASSRKAADLAGPNCCKADVEQNSNFLCDRA
jgi:cobalamin biosynthesis protein CobD/CbiB